MKARSVEPVPVPRSTTIEVGSFPAGWPARAVASRARKSAGSRKFPKSRKTAHASNTSCNVAANLIAVSVQQVDKLAWPRLAIAARRYRSRDGIRSQSMHCINSRQMQRSLNDIWTAQLGWRLWQSSSQCLREHHAVPLEAGRQYKHIRLLEFRPSILYGPVKQMRFDNPRSDTRALKLAAQSGSKSSLPTKEGTGEVGKAARESISTSWALRRVEATVNNRIGSPSHGASGTGSTPGPQRRSAWQNSNWSTRIFWFARWSLRWLGHKPGLVALILVIAAVDRLARSRRLEDDDTEPQFETLGFRGCSCPKPRRRARLSLRWTGRDLRKSAQSLEAF